MLQHWWAPLPRNDFLTPPASNATTVMLCTVGAGLRQLTADMLRVRVTAHELPASSVVLSGLCQQGLVALSDRPQAHQAATATKSGWCLSSVTKDACGTPWMLDCSHCLMVVSTTWLYWTRQLMLQRQCFISTHSTCFIQTCKGAIRDGLLLHVVCMPAPFCGCSHLIVAMPVAGVC